MVAHRAGAGVSGPDLAPLAAPCPGCGAPVVRATAPGGLVLPVDAAPRAGGTLLLSLHNGRLYAGRLGRNQAAGAVEHGQGLHATHDCPGNQHRAGRRRR